MYAYIVEKEEELAHSKSRTRARRKMPKGREFGANKDSRQARKRKVCNILDLLRIKVLLLYVCFKVTYVLFVCIRTPG